MEARFKLVFRGDIVPGYTMVDVRAKLKEMFKLEDATVNKLFAGRPMTIKKNLDEMTANKWCDILKEAGAIVEPVKDEAEPPALQEVEGPAQSSSERYGFDLAPVGADVLNPSERDQAVDLDVPVSHLSIDEVGADVLREDERSSDVELELDLSHIRLTDNS